MKTSAFRSFTVLVTAFSLVAPVGAMAAKPAAQPATTPAAAIPDAEAVAPDFSISDKVIKPAPKKGEASIAETYVAVLTIFADPVTYGPPFESSDGRFYASNLGSHAFITVRNVTSSTYLQMGGLTGIAPGRTLSFGKWGSLSEHKGLWYDVESALIAKRGYWPNRVSVAIALTQSDLTRLTSFLYANDTYDPYTSNCSNFAVGAWNYTVASTYRLNTYTLVTPKVLADAIKAKYSGYSTRASVPYYYWVYVAHQYGAPTLSTTMQYSQI